MEVPQVPTPAVPAPPLPRVPVVTPGGSRGPTFAMRLAAAATAVGAPAPTGPDDVTPSRTLAARSHDAVTLGAMLTARAGLASPTSLLAGAQAAMGRVGAGPFAGHATVVPPTVGEVTSDFGMRMHPITGSHRHHDGMDVAAPTGTAVRSVAAGTVVSAGDRGGYGLTVVVDHGNGTTTRYAHLSAIEVEVGDRLAAGDHVGAVGSTGASTGPHLHVEVRVGGEPVDPAGLW